MQCGMQCYAQCNEVRNKAECDDKRNAMISGMQLGTERNAKRSEIHYKCEAKYNARQSGSTDAIEGKTHFKQGGEQHEVERMQCGIQYYAECNEVRSNAECNGKRNAMLSKVRSRAERNVKCSAECHAKCNAECDA
jgi:hypothetical protein